MPCAVQFDLCYEHRQQKKQAREAFDKAILQGRLSDNRQERNFAGKYMYMGKYNGKTTFKNIITRQYDV